MQEAADWLRKTLEMITESSRAKLTTLKAGMDPVIDVARPGGIEWPNIRQSADHPISWQNRTR
jgi:hypothetical protein